MPFFTGYDIGSRTGKVTVIDEEGSIRHTDIADTLGNALLTYRRLRDRIPTRYRPSASSATGYGRTALEKEVSSTATEITCHALGVLSRAPGTATIIDIGGQDAKVIALEEGRVRDFVMNDRCAAGAGRFLEVMVPRLGYTMDTFAALDEERNDIPLLSSTCTVFAESELISLMAAGASPEALAWAIASMTARMTVQLAAHIHVRPPFFMTGGVSRALPVRVLLERLLGAPIMTAPDAQFTGAHGAALLLLRGHERSV